MGSPSINIIFKESGSTAIKRGDRGIVVLLLKDTVPEANPIIMNTISDIPEALSDANKQQIKLAFLGYKNAPKKVVAYVVAADTTDYATAQHYLETIKWNYLAFPEIADTEVTAFATWIKSLRDQMDIRVKMVLPNCAADHEGIINFANDKNVEDGVTYTAKQYCSRIAGLLAGTPLTISATYAPLEELDDCVHLTKTEMDTDVDAGKLILVNDGEKVKIVRAVNSLKTLSEDKGSSFQKIKIVDIMDQIHDDIKVAVSDNYIGKVPNDYDHKVLLVSAIGDYFEQLELSGLLDKGKNSVSVDIEAQTAYLKSKQIDTTSMSEQDIKEANTGSNVFIKANVKILDAIEDMSLSIAI